MDNKPQEHILPVPFNFLLPCPGLLIQNGEKLHPMLLEELDLYSAEL